jgi:hypothetical protein
MASRPQAWRRIKPWVPRKSDSALIATESALKCRERGRMDLSRRGKAARALTMCLARLAEQRRRYPPIRSGPNRAVSFPYLTPSEIDPKRNKTPRDDVAGDSLNAIMSSGEARALTFN